MVKNKREQHDELVRQIIVALSQTGLGRFWLQATGGAYRGSYLIRFGIIGGGDISGILIGGKRVEIEVKTGAGKQRESQLNFEQMIKSYGGIYLVARDVESTVEYIKTVGEKPQCNCNPLLMK